MGRIEREKRVVAKMVELYCKHKLGLDGMNDEYLELVDYALYVHHAHQDILLIST